MSNNAPPPVPLFNNNKSLYGSRTQSNQSSKKISIIEDKKTLEPVRNNGYSQGNANYQRWTSIPAPLSVAPSTSQIHRQVQIQKQALDTYDLQQLHENVYQQFNDWKESMYSRVCDMKKRMSSENERVFKELTSYHRSMKTLLEESLIKELLRMKENPHSANHEELDRIEEQLNILQEAIESAKHLNLQLDCSNVEIIGDLQLNKITDSSKYQSLPQAPPSPPPSKSTSPIPNMSSHHHHHHHHHQRFPSVSIDEHPGDSTQFSSTFDSNENQPTPPVWTDTTRQGLNQLSRHVPFRLLISNEIEKRLVENFDISQFADVVVLSCQSTNESILTIIHENNLDEAFETLTDLITAFKSSLNMFEIHLLLQKRFLPILTGKRTERLERLKSKYKLDLVQTFPQVCPQSDERVLLLRCDHSEYIIYCLREIFQNILEQSHFTDDETDDSYPMYDPSIHYDSSLTQEYGGFSTIDSSNTTFQTDQTGSTDDLTDVHRRSTNSIHSSTSSQSKNPFNIDENDLNFDESDRDSDDENDSKRSRSSDDKRIYTKELNYVKGRQVGLLIGPFGQHITQIREQTGAKIHLTNDDNEPTVIKGTRSQIEQALRLIKECLRTQKPIPRTAYKGGRRR